MANLRDIKKRINSVQSTKQITRTMEMVATAKIRHATERIAAAEPYSTAMAETLGRVAASSSSLEHPLLAAREEVKRAVAIVVVSDRGLAGGFNSNILKDAEAWRSRMAAEGVEVEVIVCGKKGASYFTYRHVEPAMIFRDLSADPTIDEAREIATYVRTQFEEGAVDEVRLFYNHARNAADQDLREEVVLPIEAEGLSGGSEAAAGSAADAGSAAGGSEASGGSEGAADSGAGEGAMDSTPEFEPSAEAVLDHLLPAYVQTMIYHALIDSAAAEQGARRKAMKSATDNATEMVETLDRLYNRARQGAITTEITEIVGGAAALEDE